MENIWRYRIPSEIIEFCDAIDVLRKTYAYPLRTQISGELYTISSEWIKFMESGSYPFEMYVNCNLSSADYGCIISHAHSCRRMVYKNVHELISDLTVWFNMIGDTIRMDLDGYLKNTYLIDGKWITYRDMFLSEYDDYPAARAGRNMVLGTLSFPEQFEDYNNLSFIYWVHFRKN